MKKVILAMCALFLAVSSTYAGDKDFTKKDVKAIVKKAVSLIEKKGDDALALISDPKGEYKKGTLYVFVYDENVTIIAHPVKPKIIGKNYKGKPDIKGKKFRDEIVQNTIKNGKAWTSYVYQKPGAKGLFHKSVFSKLAKYKGKKYIVCAGIYEKK